MLAIYPIVAGQKASQKNAIPQRASFTETSTAASASASGDLIDFGQEDSAAPIDAGHKSTSEIQSMLLATGDKAPEGSLIDFHDDLQKELPPAGIQRSDTGESHDDFVDANE